MTIAMKVLFTCHPADYDNTPHRSAYLHDTLHDDKLYTITHALLFRMATYIVTCKQ